MKTNFDIFSSVLQLRVHEEKCTEVFIRIDAFLRLVFSNQRLFKIFLMSLVYGIMKFSRKRCTRRIP